MRSTAVVHDDLPTIPWLSPVLRRTWRAPGVLTAASVDGAIDLAAEQASGSIFVAGGGEIYRAAWGRLTRLEITEVDVEPEGDTTFPAIDEAWRRDAVQHRDGYRFVSYVRVA